MIAPRDVWHDDTRSVGRCVVWFDSLPSTNDTAAEINEPGTAIVADVQTAGRGQYDRKWRTRRGASLNLSVIVAPPPHIDRPAILIAWAAIAVADALFKLTARPVHMKWPNDLLLDGKKICGILLERKKNVIVGIGLNLSQTNTELADDRLPDATSLAIATGLSLPIETALVAVLHSLDTFWSQLLAGQTEDLERKWKQHLGLSGRQVRVTLLDGRQHTGRLAELSFDAIELDSGDGNIVVLPPEHLRAMNPA